jgi:galactonate dehydratase
MKITDIAVLKADASFRNWGFVRIETDAGIVGWGETSLGHEQANEGAVKDMGRRLIGRDPRRIRELIDLITRRSYWEGGAILSSAAGAIEIALWDILGKSLDAPVHQLLGGRMRDSVLAYSNAWYFGATTPDEFASLAVETVAAGYQGLKFDPFGTAGLNISEVELIEAVARLSAVREAVGPAVRLMVEGHGRFGVHSAIRVGRALEHVGALFFEEPLPPGNLAALRRVAEAVRIPIATGERCYTARECQLAIDAGGVEVLQPDVMHVGGIAAMLSASAAAEAAFVSFAPHNASGPVATAATLQVAALAPTFLIQEMFAPHDAPWRDLVARPPIEIVDGHVPIPDGPGMGIEIVESELADHPPITRELDLYGAQTVMDHALPQN